LDLLATEFRDAGTLVGARRSGRDRWHPDGLL